ncbi:MAG: RtcB family protein [Clostridiales Family XIII bacterium]|jgi:RNA-splicing ligase RtcB|nr:RtcB family protein [Clostridiales Family XIII bacterium]
MIKVTGQFNTAICYTGGLEPAAEAQIKAVCDREEFAGCKIRIMPDVHAGMGCTIGTTMTISDKIVPGMVGVDIGCGMETVEIAERGIDFAALDRLIRSEIPCGREIRKIEHALNAEIDLNALHCVSEVNVARARRSIGTLGGGNHFIEIDRSDSGGLYLVVHSGSRHIGNEVARWYQEEAYRALCGRAKNQIAEMIASMKAEGREREIAETIKRLKNVENDTIPKDLAYVSGTLFDSYIHDMKIIQQFAVLNRRAMAEVILRGMGLTEIGRFTTIHNYIDTDSMVLRKGSVSADRGERLLIPINMRDGSLICVGRGNDEWNRSAPHGAGRLMSRTAALKMLSMDEYKSEMSGVFTTSVSRDTLDEAPMAYKPMDEIISHIAPTAEVVERLRPVYNFKASE